MATINVAPRERVRGPELFPELITGRITCRVCGREDDAGANHPALLCRPCLAHPQAVYDRVQDWLASTLRQLDAAQETWQAALDASPARERWTAVQAAIVAVAEQRMEKVVLARAWGARKAEGGALAELLTAYERYCAETDRLGAELHKLHAAQTECNAAWMETLWT